jgi:hypothetical protein
MARRAPWRELELPPSVEEWLDRVDTPDGRLRTLILTANDWVSIGDWAEELFGSRSAATIGFLMGVIIRPLHQLGMLEIAHEGRNALIRNVLN